MTVLNVIFDLIESEKEAESQEAVEVVPQTDSWCCKSRYA
jgi:hypothetical protein